jgi:hypothetical protein
MHVAALRDEVSVEPRTVRATQAGALVKLLTCGSVDDGKSTLIGRLLWDAAGVTDDQRAAVALASQNRAVNGEKIDFSLLLDGLQAEREQGITIDIAWRYFETPGRRFIIIDSPGHEQYTRNMATGASHADIAISWSMRAMAPSARPGVTPRSAIWSASRRSCSRSTRWMRSAGPRRAIAISSAISSPWPEASILRKS